MAAGEDVVLLKSTLQILNKWYCVKLTPTEVYWESLSSDRVAGGPYSQPLVNSVHVSNVNYPAVEIRRLNEPPVCSAESVVVGCQPQHADESRIPVIPPSPGRRGGHSCSSFVCCRVWNAASNDNVCSVCKKPIKAENQSVKLSNIVAIRSGDVDRGSDRHISTRSRSARHGAVELLPVGCATSFSVLHARAAGRHRLALASTVFHTNDAGVVSQWVDRINEILSWPEFERPKSVLVFINPIAGRRRSCRTYREKVAPLFELARVCAEVIVTERRNHAQSLLATADLESYDGVISVGGDGMFAEIVDGLLSNTLQSSGYSQQPSIDTVLPQPKWRIGVIPAGSTDTVSYTTQGINDPVTSALHIIIGDSISMDVGTVFHGSRFIRYNISCLGYGFYGDCIVDSEANRWMGPKRYDWEGFKKVLSNRSYEGELSFLPSTNKDSHTRDGVVCKAGCSVCHTCGMRRRVMSNSADICDEQSWQVVHGRFAAINSFLISCRCRYALDGPSPCAHLGDGCSDVVVVRECSRFDYTRHLYRCSDPHADQFDFPFVQTFRVTRFRFRPTSTCDEATDACVDELVESSSEVKITTRQHLSDRTTATSVWNCDGEVVDEPFIDFRVHPQTIRLFARGIDAASLDMGSASCLCCTASSSR